MQKIKNFASTLGNTFLFQTYKKRYFIFIITIELFHIERYFHHWVKKTVYELGTLYWRSWSWKVVQPLPCFWQFFCFRYTPTVLFFNRMSWVCWLTTEKVVMSKTYVEIELIRRHEFFFSAIVCLYLFVIIILFFLPNSNDNVCVCVW